MSWLIDKDFYSSKTYDLDDVIVMAIVTTIIECSYRSGYDCHYDYRYRYDCAIEGGRHVCFSLR